LASKAHRSGRPPASGRSSARYASSRCLRQTDDDRGAVDHFIKWSLFFRDVDGMKLEVCARADG
jgi:hypothetical protein